jgi:hypothetical protein
MFLPLLEGELNRCLQLNHQSEFICKSYMILRTALCSIVAIFTAASASAATATFSNTNAIAILDSGTPPTAGMPYPSTNVVTGLSGSVITKATVQLFGFAHTFPSDVDIVLVGPHGQNAILMSNVGGQTVKTPVTNIDLTLDDDAEANLPLESALVSGTFKPTQGYTNAFQFDFPAPAPTTAQLMGPFLSNFKNTDPNGTWSLYVVDDNAGDSGVITGGWSLTITTAPVLLSIARDQTNVVLSWTNALPGYTLQSSADLTASVWSNVLTSPVVISGNYTVTNPIATNRLFYRLAK